MSELHDRRFPGEDDSYRSARDGLLEAESELRAQVEAVASLRRELPPGGKVPKDYVFDTIEPEHGEVRLSELFAGGGGSLIVYSYMYGPDWEKPCPMCTSIIDGLNASAPHVSQLTHLVVVGKAPPEKLARVVQERGWNNLRLLSSGRDTYNADYHAETPSGEQLPMLNVFQRRDGVTRHFWASELYFVPRDGHPRHVDSIWPLWNLLDLTPEGRGTDWLPKLEY